MQDFFVLKDAGQQQQNDKRRDQYNPTKLCIKYSDLKISADVLYDVEILPLHQYNFQADKNKNP